MDNQLVIVAVSVLIGFVGGWQVGYARCKQRYKLWADLLQSMRKGKGIRKS